MTDEELIARLRLLAAWRKPGGPTPKEGMPNTYRTVCAAIDRIEVLSARLVLAEQMAEALRRLRDCDWVISLPDRMDAVRDIAREALASWDAAKEADNG